MPNYSLNARMFRIKQANSLDLSTAFIDLAEPPLPFCHSDRFS